MACQFEHCQLGFIRVDKRGFFFIRYKLSITNEFSAAVSGIAGLNRRYQFTW